MKNIIYFGYDVFSNVLSFLISSNVRVSHVFTLEEENFWNKREEIISISAKNAIPVSFHRPSREELQNIASENEVDHLVIAAIPYRVPQIQGVKAVNLHPSFLPDGRGPWPIPHYFLGNAHAFGASLHEATTELDCGPIILRKQIELSSTDNYETAIAKCQMQFEECMAQYLREPELLWEAREPQSGGSYFPFPADDIQYLDWGKTVKEISNTLRAFGRNEVSASWGGKNWLVSLASVAEIKHNKTPGEVISRFHGNVVIAACDGIVVIHNWREDS